MESSNPKGWNRLRVEYDDVGFFHGYYVRKGYRTLVRIPNWLGRILTKMDLKPTTEDHSTVWVVSWYNAGEEPIVTVFSSEENAMKYYNYELANSHVKVTIDECPIYNIFMYCPQNVDAKGYEMDKVDATTHERSKEISNMTQEAMHKKAKELNKNDPVNHPSHYTDGKIEVIDFIEDKKFNFHLANAVKYISRAGKKDPGKEIEDLKKARWYLDRYIQKLEEAPKGNNNDSNDEEELIEEYPIMIQGVYNCSSDRSKCYYKIKFRSYCFAELMRTMHENGKTITDFWYDFDICTMQNKFVLEFGKSKKEDGEG